jgi:dihydrofolate synthase / folylpolyglutamate synthase
MLAITIKTHKIKPKEKIFAILDNYLPKLTENSVVAITSKIISICENRLIDKKTNKLDLIRQESDFCFPPSPGFPNFYLTLKSHRLIPNAGIDESNCNDTYALLPKKPQISAKKIWQYLRKRDHMKNLGIIITDSTTAPLRRGVTGITLGWCGFLPTYDYVGKKDIFGRTLEVAQINLLDSLATTATLVMGEGKEQTPIVIIKNAPKIDFQNRAPTQKEEQLAYIDPKEDLFSNIDFKKLAGL